MERRAGAAASPAPFFLLPSLFFILNETEHTMISSYDSLFMPTYKRTGAPFVSGKGSVLTDAAGNKFLDFGAGIAVNALGHGHPALKKAIADQGAKLIHASNLYYTDTQTALARLLVKHSFGDRVFFCNSGTEAIEAAIKFSRKWASKISAKKFHVLSFEHCFHGRTYGAMSATAQAKFHAGFKPLVGGFHYAPFNDVAAAKKTLRKHSYAAIIVEPLQGEGGVNKASAAFLKFLRQWATRHKIVLVFDEIQCGMGRTGTLWNYERYGIKPDIMAIAKPIGGGLPLGAAVCREFLASAISPGDHGTTFGGNPVACRLGCETLSIVAKKSFLADVRKKGAYLAAKLETVRTAFPQTVTGIRGAGLLVGARLSIDPLPLVAACRQKGLLVIKAENHTLRFIPPLTVSYAEIDRAVGIFRQVLAEQAK